MVRVHKAEPFPSETIRGTIIEITRDMPPFNREELATIDARYQSDADAIEDGLHRCLPGGTYDRLLGLMLTRKATHFRVPHFVSEAMK